MTKKNPQTKAAEDVNKKEDKNSMDPVSQLKESVNKLSDGVAKMGITLGVSPKPTVTAKNENQEVKKEETSQAAKPADFERPNMTAEEKKLQRAQKAAEKKARAEAAAAKKAGLVPDKNQPANNQKNEKKKDAKGKPPQNEDSTTKSSLRKQQQNTDGKEVKFDLSSNMVKSASEENLVASIETANARAAAAEVAAEPVSSIEGIHPAFLCLSVRCEQDLCGELDQLCREFIEAFKEFLSDWSAQRALEKADISTAGRDLDVAIRPQLAHLTQNGRWSLPLALGNIVRQMKKEILKVGTMERERLYTVDDLQTWLDDSLETNFPCAYRAISENLRDKMKATPSVITYDWCPIVNDVLLNAIDGGTQQSFTIVDSEMNGKGVRHVKSLIEKGVRCRYTDLKSVGFAMQSCSMVLLGCSAVLSNGSVATARGSLQLALMARAFNVPVLVTAQSFKFVDKVQSYGRMALMGRESIELVPSDLVTAIVTDIRILPPSSAPAVLRAKALDME